MNDKEKIIASALELAEERGWQSLSLADIAGHADLPLRDAFQVGFSKIAILKALLDQMNDQLLGDIDESGLEGDLRDRMFDAIMLSLEALDPFKGGVASIVAHLRADPLTLVQLRPELIASMRLVLEACGVDSSGIRGALAIRVTGAIWTSTLQVWLEDDDTGMARTMAHLDRQLRRVSELSERVSRLPQKVFRQGDAVNRADRSSGANGSKTFH